MKVLKAFVLGLSALLTLGGCVAAMSEEHHFATLQTPTPSNPSGIVNVFRIDVDAQGSFANVRYVAGSYDERAVDFFLNEVKSSPYDSAVAQTEGPNKIWNLSCPVKDDAGTETDECKESYNEAMKVIPLSGSFDDDGTFVMILSTNANAIAETIGAFAENELAIQSFNYLINKETFDEAATINARKSSLNLQRSALMSSLEAMFTALDVAAAKQGTNTQLDIAILQTIAVALDDSRTPSFQDLEGAKAWFASLK